MTLLNFVVQTSPHHQDGSVSQRVFASTQQRRLRYWLMAGALLALSGCASRGAVKTVDSLANESQQQIREALFANRQTWSFTGKIAVSQNHAGGSGHLTWTQSEGDFDIRLTAPVTGQSWHLSRASDQFRLEGLPGGPRQGRDAEALVLEATGWRIPVMALQDWVRGVRADGDAKMDYDNDGLPVTLRQQDWSIEYKQWNRDQPALPIKVFAESGDASVRLVIEQWSNP